MTDDEIMRLLETQDEEFGNVSREHRELKEALARIHERVYLTPEEEAEKKSMQKQKLQKKDRMAELIRKYRASVTLN
jgi:hypothetical protein